MFQPIRRNRFDPIVLLYSTNGKRRPIFGTAARFESQVAPPHEVRMIFIRGIGVANEDFQRLAGNTPSGRRRFWQHCIGTAMLTREVTNLISSPDDEVDYVAGLVHDIRPLERVCCYASRPWMTLALVTGLSVSVSSRP
ncbi:MAG: HDOD domain-containing protein [Verrucomicrobiota bacterium]